MTASATCKISQTLRDLGSSLRAAARQVSRSRIVWTVVGITVLVLLASWIPLPSPMQLRDWAQSLGPWFPLAFFIAHIVVTVVPVPRTAFTLAAGLLFGPVLGIAIAVTASTASAMIAMLVVRAAGWRLNRVVRHRSIHTVDERLRHRGWLAVLSLRLIPAVPFSVLNYAAGASTVRVLPYALATLAGLLPGTAAVVILGDALAGHISWPLYLVSACTAALGLTGLVFELRQYRRHHRRRANHHLYDEPSPEPTPVGR
ncbi:MAG: TVP38/TMEM64 family protein [Mycobacterium sp.]|uniref:TVP38/TMEM64 family protein n=1 Tax=Mycobacterium sp. TaxID=1785 RepID=UPI001EB1AA84|nr:TVP38/TMEM64 family protein [Mycobacterium sp.]MBV8790281.1 TVP38/TMEM64 family protein [Mycobacterium sp.]